MKITKTQLKKIIKEELGRVMSEYSGGPDESQYMEFGFQEKVDGEYAKLMIPKNAAELIKAQKPFRVFMQHSSGAYASLEGGDMVQITSQLLQKAGLDLNNFDEGALTDAFKKIMTPRTDRGAPAKRSMGSSGGSGNLAQADERGR
jgi:hypothetical protein